MTRTRPSEPLHWRTTLWVRDAWIAAAAALAVRLAVVAWAAPRFPPAADGRFYHVVAQRIAQGLGYTWLWPDGSVTFAAHYPVGYPALVGALYAVAGQVPALAMGLNAILGAAGVYAVHRLVALTERRGVALTAAFLVALHPTLVAYTPALMTEGVTAAMVALCGWAAASGAGVRRWAARAAVLGLGLLAGTTVLIRPQWALGAPLFGALMGWWRSGGRPFWRQVCISAVGATSVTVVALTVCVPWTLRNCAKMERCVFVSANAGWNLFIGAHARGDGAWVPIEQLGVPEECREVFGEAEKDVCFGRAALQKIRGEPLAWLGLVPAKLTRTFDDVGAPGGYLFASNSAVFGPRGKGALGALEVLAQRGMLLAALLALAVWPSRWRWFRWSIGIVGVLAVGPMAWVAYAALLLLVVQRAAEWRRFPAFALLAVVLGVTFASHAVFFGAARYALVCFPLTAVVAAQLPVAIAARRAERRGRPDQGQDGVLTPEDAARDT